jgi:hypothetical protein
VTGSSDGERRRQRNVDGGHNGGGNDEAVRFGPTRRRGRCERNEEETRIG